jgi:hypothetical protein
MSTRLIDDADILPEERSAAERAESNRVNA